MRGAHPRDAPLLLSASPSTARSSMRSCPLLGGHGSRLPGWVLPHNEYMDGTVVRIAIVDDHAMFAEGLRSWLAAHDPDVKVSYLGPDPADALKVASELDAVLLDIDLGPGAPRTADTVDAFAAQHVPVLLVSALARGVPLREAIVAGASGYLSKASDPAELLTRLRQVARGEYVVTREVAEVMCSPAPPDLSGQELRALQLYAQGLPLKVVARRMSISQYTAKEYLDRVRAKYAASGRAARTKTELHSVAREDGLLTDEH